MTEQPRKVYLASSGSYSDYRILNVFAREEDALAYELGEDVEEFELLDGPQEVRNWHTLSWSPDKPEPDYEYSSSWGSGRFPNPHEDPHPVRRDYDGHPNRVEHQWVRGWGQQPRLVVSGWELERIRKVFGEQRAMWLNNKALGMVWDEERLEWTP